MAEPILISLFPGVQMWYDQDRYTVESKFTLGGFAEGADIKVYLDVRLVDVITKEQSKAESLVILRTK